jgi:glucose/arabinose dehydrogenase
MADTRSGKTQDKRLYMRKKKKYKRLVIVGAGILIVILAIVAYLLIPRTAEEAGFETEVLLENLDTPWSIDFLPDDVMIFTERGGRVTISDGRRTKTIGDLDVSEESESGLLGLAVDPEFDKNKFIYIYYTYKGKDAKWNKVSRFTLNENLTNETVLLDKIPSARFHDGGRIKFGPDGKLYVTTGDATKPSTSQDKKSLAGKILRMNKDGSMAGHNPFGNYVYSYGHRNPQGIVWHPSTKELYSSEHGPSKRDEINIIKKGKNYGWPEEKCDETTGKYEDPIVCYADFTIAPSGIAFYKGDLYVAGLRGTQLRRIKLDKNNKVIKEEELFTELGRIRDAVSHNGYLYILTNNRDGRGIPRAGDDKIIRVKKT